MQRDERKAPEEARTGHMRLHQDAVTRYLAKHPQDDLVLVLTRNKNANCVCYVVRRDGTGAAQPKKPLHMYWLDIDPSYQKAARAKGRTSDRVELNLLERNMAFGVKATLVQAVPRTHRVTFQAFPRLQFTLDGASTSTPRLRTIVGGRAVSIQRVHINEQPAQGLRAMRPAVTNIILLGRDCETNRAVQHIVWP